MNCPHPMLPLTRLCLISVVTLAVPIAWAAPVKKPVGDRAPTRSVSVETVLSAELTNQHADFQCGITRDNVGTLGLAWAVKTEQPVSSSALIDGNDLYFADWGGSVYKVDARTGDVVWKKSIHTPKAEWPWHGFAGTGTLTNELYIVAAVEGKAYGVNKKTGEVVWETAISDDPEGGSVATLLHHEGTVYLGLQSVEEPLSKQKGFEVNFRGAVMALDAATGEVRWKRATVEPPLTGVGVWSSFALDPTLGLLYFNTGNTYTGEEAAPLSDALVAVRADNGEIQWARQTYEHDVWLPGKPLGPDYDFGAGPQLLDVSIDGRDRGLVIAGQKSGLLWAFDRSTGERVWATSIGYGGVEGGIMGEASIGDGVIYAWSNNGYFHARPPQDHALTVKKLDAATGRPLWVVDAAQPPAIYAGGLLADGVYLVGSVEGTLVAYDTATGKTLWKTQSQSNVANSLRAADGRLYAPSASPEIFKWMPDDAANGMYCYEVGKAPPTPTGAAD